MLRARRAFGENYAPFAVRVYLRQPQDEAVFSFFQLARSSGSISPVVIMCLSKGYPETASPVKENRARSSETEGICSLFPSLRRHTRQSADSGMTDSPRHSAKSSRYSAVRCPRSAKPSAYSSACFKRAPLSILHRSDSSSAVRGRSGGGQCSRGRSPR